MTVSNKRFIQPYLTAVTYMLVINGLGHEGDSQYDDAGNHKEENAEVEVVDSTYDGGTATGIDAAACPIDKLSDHPGEAN